VTPAQIAGARRLAQARVNEMAAYIARIGAMARAEQEARETAEGDGS
jgi:hypothetical protein